MKIVILEGDSVGRDVSWDRLKKFGKVICYAATPQSLVETRIRKADIIIPNKCKIGSGNLETAKCLKLICEAATGYNNIDLEMCSEKKIAVTNVRGYSTDVVAQHTFTLLLALYEKPQYYSEWVSSGSYSAGESFTRVGPPFYEFGTRFHC